MSYLLETKELTKQYKKQYANDKVNFCVEEGGIYGLLGPNGAGKSTLLKMVTGMIEPTSGSILFKGQRMTRKDLVYIGALIENAPIYEELTARENLKIRTLLYGLPDSRISEVLEIVGLQDTGRKPAGKFSLGMKQRLGIAIALLNHPKLLILDEPTNGLDPIAIHEFRDLVKRFKIEGTTVIISSHILSEVEHVVDTVGIIYDGKLVYQEKLEKTQDLETLFTQIIRKAAWAEPEAAKLYIQAVAIAFPLMIAIVTTLVYEADAEAGSFCMFHTLADRKVKGHIGNLLALLLYGSGACILAVIGFGMLYRGGIVFGEGVAGMVLEIESVLPLSFYVEITCLLFGVHIASYLLQYILCYTCGKAISLGWGIVGLLQSPLLYLGIGDRIWKWIPCNYGIRMVSYDFILNGPDGGIRFGAGGKVANLVEYERYFLEYVQREWETEQRRKDNISALAHDIKTPVTIIKGNAELLQEEVDIEQVHCYAEVINTNTDRIEHYIRLLINEAKGVDENSSTSLRELFSNKSRRFWNWFFYRCFAPCYRTILYGKEGKKRRSLWLGALFCRYGGKRT